jgi:hypothetical protein
LNGDPPRPPAEGCLLHRKGEGDSVALTCDLGIDPHLVLRSSETDQGSAGWQVRAGEA